MARFLLVVQVDGSLACRRHPCQRTVVEDVEEVKELAKEPQVGAAVCLSFISLFLSAARVYWRPSLKRGFLPLPRSVSLWSGNSFPRPVSWLLA